MDNKREDELIENDGSTKKGKDTTRETPDVSRRGFLSGLGSMGAVAAVGGVGLGTTLATPESAEALEIGPENRWFRQNEGIQLKIAAARSQRVTPFVKQPCNHDDDAFPDRRASFTKTLPHDDLGEVDPFAYQTYLDALDSGVPADFDAIPLSPVADRKLANPQAAYAFDLNGRDGHATRMLAAPSFAGAFQAAEMGEVYWQALTRDVPFVDYDADATVAAAVADMNGFSQRIGPTDSGAITSGTLFRGETPGDLIGPYVSQFLWRDIQYGPSLIVQRYNVPVAGDDFMLDFPSWLAIQRGAAPPIGITVDGTQRYIFNNRSLGEYVHVDYLFQAYLNAMLILLGMGPDAVADANPYKDSANQGSFVTFGPPGIGDLVTRAANASLKAAWYQKWLVHRRLRPEVFAARVEIEANGTKTYGVHPDILASDSVGRLLSQNGNRLLPMAFPEGSPTHPSYPAGHATVAGACSTVLKAFFKEDYVIPNPVVADATGSNLDPWTGADLTVGNELNKLANNISIGRDASGVHYRTDGVNGVEVGEQIGLTILQDYTRTYNEDFDGFDVLRFDGQRVLIRDGAISEVI